MQCLQALTSVSTLFSVTIPRKLIPCLSLVTIGGDSWLRKSYTVFIPGAITRCGTLRCGAVRVRLHSILSFPCNSI